MTSTLTESGRDRRLFRSLSSLCIQWIVAVLTVTPIAAQEPLALPLAAFEQGRYDDVVGLLDDFLASPHDSQGAVGIADNAATRREAHYWRLRSYYELERYQEAVDAGERAAEIESEIEEGGLGASLTASKRAELSLWLGRAAGRLASEKKSMGWARRSRREFERAVELDPDNLEARRALVQFHARAPFLVGGSKKRAREQIVEISARDPVAGMLAQADYDQRTKAEDRAASGLRKILAEPSASVEALFEVAAFFRDRRQATPIEEAVARAQAKAPEDPRLDFYRGVLAVLAERDLDQGEQALRRYLELSPQRSGRPSHARAHAWLGEIYLLRGNHDRGRAELERALELDPELEGLDSRLDELSSNP